MKRLAVVLLLVLAPCATAAPSTELISVGMGGGPANDHTSDAAVSADGRYVAFESSATNLVPGDTNGKVDVFLRDRLDATTTRLSVAPDGSQGNDDSGDVTISADGRYVAFSSRAKNLTTAYFEHTGVFLWERATGAVRIIPLPPPLVTARSPALSDDGTRIAYSVPSYGLGQLQVFVTDTATGAQRHVSVRQDGQPLYGHNTEPSLSPDGRWVAWASESDIAVAGDTNDTIDVIAENLDTGYRYRASVTDAGGQANGLSQSASIDASGCLVGFSSLATNLVADDDGTGVPKAYVRNRCTGRTELLSRSLDGSAQGDGTQPEIASDGCSALFDAYGVFGAGHSLVVRGRCASTVERADLSTGGFAANRTPYQFDLSGGTARYVAWVTGADNLLTTDTNAKRDVYLRDRGTNTGPSARLAVTDLGGGRFAADARGSSDPDGFRLGGQIAWGGAATTPGLAGEQTLPAGTHTITATVTDADGAAATAEVTVAVPASPASAPTAPAPARLPARALVLDRVALSRTRFAVAPSRGKARGNRGATLGLRLSEDATVTVAVQQVRRGRRSGTRCVPGRRRGTRCTTTTSKGATTHRLRAGTRTIALTGRVGTRALPRGAYELVVSARTVDDRRAAPKTLPFSIVRPTR